MQDEPQVPVTTIPETLEGMAKALVEKQTEIDRLRHALILCLPIMEEEFDAYGPREPEKRAIQSAKEALHA